MFTPYDEIEPSERVIRVRVPEGQWAWRLGKHTTIAEVKAAAIKAATDYFRNVLEPQIDRQLAAVSHLSHEDYQWRLESSRPRPCP